MIEIKNLTQEDVGRWVVYTDGVGETERGKLKSWNDTNVFVVYNANDNWDADHWKGYTGQSTRPEDLDFA